MPGRNQPRQGHLSLLKRTIEIHLDRLVAWDGCSPKGLSGAVLTKDVPAGAYGRRRIGLRIDYPEQSRLHSIE